MKHIKLYISTLIEFYNLFVDIIDLIYINTYPIFVSKK